MNGENQQNSAPGSGSWQFKPDATPPVQKAQPLSATDYPTTQQSSPEVPLAEVSWSASEFIAHEKSAMWYVALFGTTIVVVALIYLLTKDIIAVVAIGFVGILFGFLAAHKPRVLNYHLDSQGLTIDQKFYPYSDFKSFGVVQEGAFSSIVFMPMKRFMPTLTVYYPPENEDQIVNALSQYMPFAPAAHDLVDKMMRRIRL